jgi:aminoglycoside phosphotransferase (APT) family kinase protein
VIYHVLQTMAYIPQFSSTELSSFLGSILNTAESITFERDRIREASDHQIWVVNDNLILRIAINPDEDFSSQHRLESTVKELIRGVIDPISRFIIPCCFGLGPIRSEQGIEHSATLDERKYGVDLEHAFPTAKTMDDLSRIFRAVWGIRSEDVGHLEIPEKQIPDPRNMLSSAQNAWRRLILQGQIQSSVLSVDCLLADFDIVLEEHSVGGPNVLLHADLKGEHVIVDPTDTSVVGVLDWTDTGLGSPAIDICGLAITVGSTMALRISQRAGCSHSAAWTGVFIARCETLVRLDARLNGDDSDSPESLLRRQLFRAFDHYDKDGPLLQLSGEVD